MAGTAVDCLGTPALIEAARADHAARLARSPYRCPLPDDVQPPIQPRPTAASAA
jgi:aminobenzoyl-glutamate utilization protein B